jgi:hypothetical protein
MVPLTINAQRSARPRACAEMTLNVWHISSRGAGMGREVRYPNRETGG